MHLSGSPRLFHSVALSIFSWLLGCTSSDGSPGSAANPSAGNSDLGSSGEISRSSNHFGLE